MKKNARKKWKKPRIEEMFFKDAIHGGAVAPCAKTVDELSCLIVGGQPWPPNT